MSKIIISEERLNAIIAKSINEALEDEGLGTRIARGLGNAAQWVQNRVNNYKNAFDAGRNKQRYANKDYDPYQGMKNADAVRNFGGDEYGQYRYNITADRNNNAATSWTNSFGTKTQNNPSNNGDRVSNYQGGRNPNAQGDVSEPGANPDSAQSQNVGAQPNADAQPNVDNSASSVKQQRVGAQQRTAQNFMASIRSGQPFMMTQSIKKYIGDAAKYYQQAHPNAVNNNAIAKVYQAVSATQNGQMFNPQTVSARLMQTLINDYGKNRQWRMNEQKIREAVAHALRKYINENYRRR